MADVLVNQLTADPQELFTKPIYNGYNEIDLAQPELVQLAPNANGPVSARRRKRGISVRQQGRGATCRSACRRRTTRIWPVTIDEPVTRLMMAAATSAGSETFSSGQECADGRFIAPS